MVLRGERCYESIDERDLVSILVQVDVVECGEALCRTEASSLGLAL
jgi:hypothetical protein